MTISRSSKLFGRPLSVPAIWTGRTSMSASRSSVTFSMLLANGNGLTGGLLGEFLYRLNKALSVTGIRRQSIEPQPFQRRRPRSAVLRHKTEDLAARIQVQERALKHLLSAEARALCNQRKAACLTGH